MWLSRVRGTMHRILEGGVCVQFVRGNFQASREVEAREWHMSRRRETSREVGEGEENRPQSRRGTGWGKQVSQKGHQEDLRRHHERKKVNTTDFHRDMPELHGVVMRKYFTHIYLI